ncbi:MAG: hypothetical protein Q9213_003486 [Squamulea squamosa]
MEPISLIASLGGIIELSLKAIQCLKELKHGSKDRIRLRDEIRSISSILSMLQDRVEDADSEGNHLASIKMLSITGGPLDQLDDALKQLIKKLAPGDRLRQMSRALLWPLTKQDATDLMAIIERQKTAFTLAIQNDNIGLSLAIKSQVMDMSDKFVAIEDFQAQSRQQAADQEFQNIVTWLSPLDFWARQQDIISRRTEDTGKRFLESTEFQSWQNGSEKVLWCHGIQTLAHTPPSMEHAVAFIYCNYKERGQQTFGNLISSVIKQLINRKGTIPDELRLLYQHHLKQGTRPNRLDIVVFLLLSHLNAPHFFSSLTPWTISTLRTALPDACILITSRRSHDIELLFRNWLHLEIRASEHDIRRYISSQITHQPRMQKHIEADPSLLSLIEETIVQKSDGMFLLAQLHVGALATKHTRKAIRSALQSLPAELDNTYDEALQRINDQNHEDAALAKNALLWAVLASNPLTVVELQHAIGTMSLDNEIELDEEDLPDADILISVCAGIIIIDSESNVVRLVHYTAQKYFERNPIFDPSVAQAKMTETCIAYLSLQPLREGPCDDNEALRDRSEKYPFVGYAARNWGNHAGGKPEDDCREVILAFLSNKNLRASALDASGLWHYAQEEDWMADWLKHYRTGISSLATAAAFGLANIVKYLLCEGLDIDAVDDKGITALMCSAHTGYTATIRALLEAGADIDKSNVSGVTALMAAASKGYDDAVQLLVENGANLDSTDRWEHTALHKAIIGGFTSTAMLLLDKGANLNPTYISLDSAIYSGSAAMVDIVSNKAAEANEGNVIESSLHYPLRGDCPSTEVLTMLIRKEASLTVFNKDGQTPIHLAAQTGRVDAVRLFLNHGVAPNLRSQDGYTPLHWATFNGSLETVNVLVDYGADLTAQNDAGETVLHTCLLYKSHDNIVSFIVRNGVPVNAADARGRGALHEAARRGYASTIQILVEHGADIDMQDQLGWTPLQDAAASGEEAVVEQLLNHMAIPRQPSLTNLLAGARLRAAVAREEFHVIQELLGKPGIDVNIQDHKGRSALHHAAYRGQEETVRSLLERGASVHARRTDSAYSFIVARLGNTDVDEYKWITPLNNAAGKGHADIVEIFLSHGADMNERPKAFDIAVSGGYANVAKVLLDYGAPVSGPIWETRRTPLFWSALFGYEDVVRLLLENGAVEERDAENGKEALLRALDYKHAGVVELLKSYGFKID